MEVNYEKLGRMLKPIVPEFHSDLSVRLSNNAQKQVPVKLEPIVSVTYFVLPFHKRPNNLVHTLPAC